MNAILENKHAELTHHPLYQKITTLKSLKIFMKYHVFAVWDFMSLLKSLQREITSVSIPWRQSSYNPKLVRLINEIVLAEESDIDFNGEVSSHFALYLKAMEEVGADTSLIKEYLRTGDLNILPRQIQEMITFHLDLANNSKVHEVAASFFYGREKLIPDMFTSILAILNQENLDCPSLKYYLARHIEIDGDEHGPMASECLAELLDSDQKRLEAVSVAQSSLIQRDKLWSFILSEL